MIASLLAGQEQEFFFPEGFLGFASYRRFGLSRYQPGDGSSSPFFFLRALEEEASAELVSEPEDSEQVRAADEEISFPLISPHLLVPDYHLAPPAEVLTKLGAGSMAELVVLVIVTLRERMEEITVNLQGPLLLNLVSRLGLQLVVEDYPVRYPLLNAATTTHHSEE
jgi:flagellar assembly factor FliW